MRARSTSRPPRQLQFGAVMLGVCAVLAAPAAVRAQTSPVAPTVAATQRYDLPAAPVAEMLRAIARTSGKRIEFDLDSVSKAQSGPIQGALSAEQAVARALAGTPLAMRELDDGSLWVALPAKLSAVLIVAKRDQAETSFMADRSDTATRSGTSLMEVPQSVTIITSKVLESQQAISVRDALANVSGVAFTHSPQGKPLVSVRGYSQTAATVNGVTDESASLSNVFGVERIEVLKGPQAILAGGDSLGGGVNIVTKKPQAETIRSLLLQYGSHGDSTVAADVGGSVTEDGKLSFRVIAAGTKAQDSTGGFNGREDRSLLPQLRWKDVSTDLIVGLSRGEQYQPVPLYTFARRDGLIMPVPGIRLGNAEDGFDSTQSRAFYQWEQKFAPRVTLVSRLQRSVADQHLHLRAPFGLAYDQGAASNSPNGTVVYPGLRWQQDTRTASGDHYLRIEAGTGPVAHKLSVGLNHSDYDYQQTEWSVDRVQPMVYPPDLGFVFPDLVANAQTVSGISRVKSSQAGVFLQDLMSWGDWNLLVNLRRTRYSTASSTQILSANLTFDTPKVTVHSTTPGIGLVYSLTPSTSLYASYAEGFKPQTTPKCGGGIVPPLSTRNRELGAKFDLLDGKLLLTTAAFELAQSNDLSYDQINDCTTVRDSQVSRGMELDLQGQLSPGWNAILNYTYTTVKDVGDKTTLYPGLAKHKMSLWSTYELQGEAWHGLGFGLGLSASSKVDGSWDIDHPFTIPGRAQLDASLFYKRDKWSLTFGVKNIGDRLQYGVSNSSAYVPVLEGRNYMLTVKRDFN